MARNRGPRRKAPEVPETVRKAKRKAMLPPKRCLFPLPKGTLSPSRWCGCWVRIELEQIEVFRRPGDQRRGQRSFLETYIGRKPNVTKQPEAPWESWHAYVLEGNVKKNAPSGCPKIWYGRYSPKYRAPRTFAGRREIWERRPRSARLVKSWAMAFGMGVTGHSGRRNGGRSTTSAWAGLYHK